MGRYPKYSHAGVSLARNLRRSMTPAERKLWAGLRGNRLGVRFRRQVPIGEYVADFLSMKNKLIVEVDGSQHLQSENTIKDQKRDAYFRSQGFAVLRYFNSEVLQNIDSVLQDISDRISHNE